MHTAALFNAPTIGWCDNNTVMFTGQMRTIGRRDVDYKMVQNWCMSSLQSKMTVKQVIVDHVRVNT